MIFSRKDVTQEKENKQRIYYNTAHSYLVMQPSAKPDEQGLTGSMGSWFNSVERTGRSAVLVV